MRRASRIVSGGCPVAAAACSISWSAVAVETHRALSALVELLHEVLLGCSDVGLDICEGAGGGEDHRIGCHVLGDGV